jgi:hypothetical protein
MAVKVVRTPQEEALHVMREADLQAQVIRLGRSLGYGTTLSNRKAMLREAEVYKIVAPPLDGLIYHPRYSLGSEPGWPDLTLLRRSDRRIVYAELKTERGQLSDRQAEVLDLLRWIADGDRVQVHVWRPSDLANGHIAEVLR